MSALLKKLRLYRIVTVLKIVPNYYRESGRIAQEYNLSHMYTFKDMLRSFVKFGASYENYEVFRFWEHDDNYKDSFITWRRNMAIMYKFNTPEAKELFLDKVRWNKRFAKYVKRDWLYCKEASADAIKKFLETHVDLVLKKIDGACGVGIEKYKARDILANKPLLISLGGGNIILEEAATNVDVIRRFSPSSLNTIRIVTCIDRADTPHIIAAAFRMGDGKSHTDNLMTGGIACSVDVNTGIVGTDGKNVEGKIFKEHPFSHLAFRGFQIPCWEEVKTLVKELAMEVPEARFVGWDVVLSDKGIDILEGNIPPAEELTELDLKGKYHQVMKMY